MIVSPVFVNFSKQFYKVVKRKLYYNSYVESMSFPYSSFFRISIALNFNDQQEIFLLGIKKFDNSKFYIQS